MTVVSMMVPDKEAVYVTGEIRHDDKHHHPHGSTGDKFAETSAQQSKKIDTLLSPSFFRLPFIPDPRRKSLALRNLLRGNTFALPWGERIASALRLQPLPAEAVDLTDIGFPARRTPFWFYVLREAEVEGGEHLGRAGGQIVGEVPRFAAWRPPVVPGDGSRVETVPPRGQR